MDTKHEQPSLLNEQDTNIQRSVECLGLTFESDEARRSYFLEILREKLRDPQFREIEGFPIGDDEDILALSDPPYYFKFRLNRNKRPPNVAEGGRKREKFWYIHR